ncbi:unnamed protein product, partial [Ilex paraguariensis]
IPSVHIMLENLWESNSVMESHGRRFLVDAKEQRFRQYGRWDRCSELYPDEDLAYTVGVSSYQTDWFFAH